MANVNATWRQLGSLSDDQAIRVLKIVVEHDRLPVPADDWDTARDEIEETIKASGLEAYAPSGSTHCSDGDLARITLRYVAESGEHAIDLIDQAITYVREPGERFDPVTLSLGALVLAVLQTDLKLKRDSKGDWTFEFHKKAMRDSTLGKVITAFIDRFTNLGS